MKSNVITSPWITWESDLNEMLHLIEFKYYFWNNLNELEMAT
jgi:hypothetical protein